MIMYTLKKEEEEKSKVNDIDNVQKNNQQQQQQQKTTSFFYTVRVYLVFLACHTHTNCKTIKPSIISLCCVTPIKHFSGQAAIFS